VDPVVTQIMEAVRQMKCVDGKEDAIELALQEALANAVVHGAKEDPTKIVECLVACDEQRGILIIVRDPGPRLRSSGDSQLHHGREPLLQSRARNFPHQSIDGRSAVPQERHRDPHGQALAFAASDSNRDQTKRRSISLFTCTYFASCVISTIVKSFPPVT
jgi:hypothetical protein